jgi:hypothetical protein
MPKTRSQKNIPMTHAERQKRYQKKLLVQALSTNAVTRRKAQKLLQRQKTRKKANRPVLNSQSSVRQRSSNPTMTWMSMTRKFSASNLRTHLQHAVAAPAVVDGCQLPKAPNPDDRDVWFKDDDGVWRLWLHRRASEIPNSGFGLFAARSFKSASIITKYCGQTTRNHGRSLKWQTATKTKGYVFQFKDTSGDIWVVPNSHCFYGHYMNHCTNPNCEVDAESGIIRAKIDIDKNTEMTLDYGTDYTKTW